MFELNKLIRPNILALEAYSCARDEYSGKKGIFLDANENPYGSLNRYPDPQQTELKKLLSEKNTVSPENILIGNGSDEIIDLVFRVFCSPGKDKALTISPTYGMYKVCADINDIDLIEVPLKKDLQPDYKKLSKVAERDSIKLLILCSPNNPTGSGLDIEETEILIRNFNGIVLIDEAYIDFSSESSWITSLKEFPNLVICQTMSKALGLAGARIGIAYSDKNIISVLNKIKPPYNVSTLNQKAAIKVLQNPSLIQSRLNSIAKEKDKLITELANLDLVKKVYPSDTNFVLAEFDNPDKVYSCLLEKNIIVRNRSSYIPGCLRITIGSPYENNLLLNELQSLFNQSKSNTDNVELKQETGKAEIKRNTAETDIFISLDVNGNGDAQINTGIGFFDHMLSQIAAHSGVNLTILADGDLETGDHHTIEDVAICLGEAFNTALADRSGIDRYGFMLPMDDSLATVALDFGGRSWLVWDLDFNSDNIAGVSAEMFKHFFKSFSDSARCNLNIKASGENDHHKIEAVFKAFARSIKMAVSPSSLNKIASTKGIL